MLVMTHYLDSSIDMITWVNHHMGHLSQQHTHTHTHTHTILSLAHACWGLVCPKPEKEGKRERKKKKEGQGRREKKIEYPVFLLNSDTLSTVTKTERWLAFIFCEKCRI